MSKTQLPPNAKSFRGFVRPSDHDDIPPPPYQVSDVYMNFVGARFDPGAVRKLLPHGLEPVDEHTGTMCVYSARFG